jgi:FSR family fosmidomycin resistance protein-like MFS transporter
VAALVEPSFGLLADTGRRRAVVILGGIAFGFSLAAAGLAWGYIPLLVALVVMWPASGAFVSISQAALMDLEPGREERNMARWTLAGSVGVLIGPLVLAAAAAAGLGWRIVFLGFAAGIVPLVLAARRVGEGRSSGHGIRHAAGSALSALRRWRVLRWLLIVEFADLMGDVLTGYLALYLVDAGHLSVVGAALALVLWSGAGLAGDALLIPLLARVRGVPYLRVSAAMALLVYPAFLLLPTGPARFGLLALLALLRAGWYAIPTGRLYAELAGSSGVAVSLGSAAGLFGFLPPLLIGLAAQRFGLSTAMWIPMVAPIALLAGLWRGQDSRMR